MRKRPVLIISIALVPVVAAFFLSGRTRTDVPIRTSGIIEGTEVNLSSKAAGRISFICCREGDPVKAGDVAIRLESDDLRASVDQARAGVAKARAAIKVTESSIGSARANAASAEADIRTAESDLEKAKVHFDQAIKDKERAESLYRKEFISKESLDSALTAHDAAHADYLSAKARLVSVSSKRDVAAAQLLSAESQLNSANAELKSAGANLAFAEAKFEDTVIKSPISGTVTLRAFERGEIVSPGVTILTVVDLNDLYARVDIEETMIDDIVVNGEAFVSTPGNPGKALKGRVVEIGRYAEFATQTDVRRGRQDIRTFRVKVRVNDPTGILKPGMTAQVEMPRRMKK